MACGSGCCGPPQEAIESRTATLSNSQSTSHVDRTPATFIADAGGETAVASSCKTDSGSSQLVSDKTRESTSDVRATDEVLVAAQVDQCCGPSPAPAQSQQIEVRDQVDDCRDSCCSDSAGSGKPTDLNPGCCDGKPSPCCSTSCINRITMRECEARNCSEASCQGINDASTQPGSEGRKPCGEHSRSAYSRYRAQLDALGCICRALLALGQESCCAPQRQSLVKRRGCRSPIASTHASVASFSSLRSSVKSDRNREKSLGSQVSQKSYAKRCCDKPKANSPPVKDDCKKGCCSKPKSDSGQAKDGQSDVQPPARTDCSKGCCFKTKIVCLPKAVCVDDCCDDETVPSALRAEENALEIKPATDPERNGLSGKERVVLVISGMTCTGCETKLQRTLANLVSVTQLKTSLVLARAEFDVDLGISSPADVIKHLERTTEFKCERVVSQGSTLDIICAHASAQLVNNKWPEGVTEMKTVSPNTVRVCFDPRDIGARDLVESGWDTPMSLAPPQGDRTLETGSRHVRHVGYMTLLSIVLTIPVLVLAWAPFPEKELAYASVSLGLATIVQVAIAGPFYPKALKSMIFSRVIEMDLLIVLSTSAAYIFSVVSFVYLAVGNPLSTGQFFETSTLLITLIMVGRYVAALARQKAVESISIRSLQVTSATIVDSAGGEREIDARLLQHGDVFKVSPDSKVPTDGVVVLGASEVDESMMTGESRPVEKHPGSVVIAGSINGFGTLQVRLTRLPGDNTISTIANMMDEAKLSKPKIQEMADRIATFFVPVVVALAIITFVIWTAIGVAVRNQSSNNASIQAITYAITVLIVSCPCAIGLAVPMVIVVATGVAAERGVIFKSADSIEVAHKASHVVFDKTGTLTQGKLSIVREEYLGNDPMKIKSLLLGLTQDNKHPVSRAVTLLLKTQDVTPNTKVLNSKSVVGKGIEGRISNDSLRAGNVEWLDVAEHATVQAFQAEGHTTFCFSINGSLAAILGLSDSLRADALSTVNQLHASNIQVHLLSGDDDGPVRSIASELGIPETHIRSRCTPAEKQAYIKDLITTPVSIKDKKPKNPVVMFVGDGTNDAAALAQATIGVHINEGTDIAQSAADVVLMRPNLAGILTAISVSKKSYHRIVFNFGWSFVYNLFAVLLAAGAFVSARIPPAYAGLGELVSVLPVIAAAVMLRWTDI